MHLIYGLGSWLIRTTYGTACGLRTTGLERLPKSEGFLLASNHRSNLDPPLIGSVIPREIHYLAKQELFRYPGFSQLLKTVNVIPVRRGQFDRQALKICLELLARGRPLLFFPEGTRAPADGFLKAKIGIGWIACTADVPIVPVYIHGTAEARPFKGGRPQIDIIFGEPFRISDVVSEVVQSRAGYQSASDGILNRIRSLSLSTPDGRVRQIGPIYDRTVIKEEKLR